MIYIYRIVLGNQDGHLRNQSFIPLTEKISTWNHCQIYRVPTQFLALFHCTGQYTPLAWATQPFAGPNIDKHLLYEDQLQWRIMKQQSLSL